MKTPKKKPIAIHLEEEVLTSAREFANTNHDCDTCSLGSAIMRVAGERGMTPQACAEACVRVLALMCSTADEPDCAREDLLTYVERECRRVQGVFEKTGSLPSMGGLH